jgi:hypothetical protein
MSECKCSRCVSGLDYEKLFRMLQEMREAHEKIATLDERSSLNLGNAKDISKKALDGDV